MVKIKIKKYTVNDLRISPKEYSLLVVANSYRYSYPTENILNSVLGSKHDGGQHFLDVLHLLLNKEENVVLKEYMPAYNEAVKRFDDYSKSLNKA